MQQMMAPLRRAAVGPMEEAQVVAPGQTLLAGDPMAPTNASQEVLWRLGLTNMKIRTRPKSRRTGRSCLTPFTSAAFHVAFAFSGRFLLFFSPYEMP